jgi:hypothetical protein
MDAANWSRHMSSSWAHESPDQLRRCRSPDSDTTWRSRTGRHSRATRHRHEGRCCSNPARMMGTFT